MFIPAIHSDRVESSCVASFETTGNLACEQASSEGGKKNSASESVIPWAKRVRVGAWVRERSEWDAGEPVDIVFDTPFRPLVISLLQISQVGN